MAFLERQKIEETLRDQLLSRLLERHGGIENLIYKFYQHSFKVYRVQALTEEAVGLLQSVPFRQ
jgi:hypothetical protein